MSVVNCSPGAPRLLDLEHRLQRYVGLRCILRSFVLRCCAPSARVGLVLCSLVVPCNSIAKACFRQRRIVKPPWPFHKRAYNGGDAHGWGKRVDAACSGFCAVLGIRGPSFAQLAKYRKSGARYALGIIKDHADIHNFLQYFLFHFS